MMTHETMLKCIRFDLEHLKDARGSDYSGVEALEMALDILDPKPIWKPNFRYGMRVDIALGAALRWGILHEYHYSRN